MTTARPMIPFSVSYTDGPFELIEYRRRGGFASRGKAHAPCAWLKGPDDCKTIRSVSSFEASTKRPTTQSFFLLLVCHLGGFEY